MDLNTVAVIRQPRERADLALAPGEAFLGGGSWLFSEPQDHLTGLVDLTTMGWAPIEVTGYGLSIAATCTFTELSRFEISAAELAPATPAIPATPPWAAVPLFRQCCTALLGSFKVWHAATVGGNICLALPAGPMTSLGAALDADALIWMPDGHDRRVRVLDFVTGVESTVLAPGEVLRSIEIPTRALTSRTGFRKIALSPLGRSGTVVIARLDTDGGFAVTVSGGTDRPVQLRFGALPTAAELASGMHGIDNWYDDAHGAPDWRQAMSALLAEQLRTELAVTA